jgi:hypothetical protein
MFFLPFWSDDETNCAVVYIFLSEDALLACLLFLLVQSQRPVSLDLPGVIASMYVPTTLFGYATGR